MTDSIIPIAVFLFFAWRLYVGGRNKTKNYSACCDLISAYSKELAIKKKQMIVSHGYGISDRDRWEKEKQYFYDNVLRAQIGHWTKVASFREEIMQLIEETVASVDIKSADQMQNMNPTQYEHYVAAVLNESGWQAATTKGSGDQGIDVIATRGSIKVVIQCKLYSSPVGNSAVQEVIAGREFSKAGYAAVVSNIGYTLPAKQLAAASNVFLLHDAELPELYFKITGERLQTRGILV